MEKLRSMGTLLFCTFLIFGCKKKNLVINSPAYAIGTITYYYNSQNFGGDNSVEYSFIVGGETYGNNYTNSNWGAKWDVPHGSFKKGDMFMVEFDAGCSSNGKCNDGDESRMLFNYQVHDSTDYNNYVAQFAVTPPKP